MFKRLIFNSEMIDFLSVTSDRISDILLHGGGDLISEEGNFIKKETGLYFLGRILHGCGLTKCPPKQRPQHTGWRLYCE